MRTKYPATVRVAASRHGCSWCGNVVKHKIGARSYIALTRYGSGERLFCSQEHRDRAMPQPSVEVMSPRSTSLRVLSGISIKT